MPNLHFYIIIFGYIFGSVITHFMMKMQWISFPFYVRYDPGNAELRFALIQCAVFFLTMLLGKRLLKKSIKNQVGVIKNNNLTKEIKNHKKLIVIIFIVFFITTITTAYYWDEIFIKISQRHSGNQTIARIVLFTSLILIILIHKNQFQLKIFLYSLIIYFGTIPSAISSNRSVAIPFIVAGISFTLRKNYITAIIFFYLCIVALYTAFTVRSHPSFFNYWNEFYENMISIDLFHMLKYLFQYSFPGLSTIQAALSIQGELSLTEIFNFLLYISPVPSSFLPKSLFENLSLSSALGIDQFILGINQDIYSEGIVWFGYHGAWLYTFILAILILMPYYFANRYFSYSNNFIYLFCLFVNIFLLFGGQVFTLRTGTRASFLLIIMMLSYQLFIRLRVRRKSLSDRINSSKNYKIQSQIL